jgi:hypothetical protein
MSPYPATRRNGICSGSLWKSHSRAATSTSSSSSTPHKPPQSDDDTANSGFDDAPFSFDGILAEANERQRAHEFCVLVGNTMWSYSDVWAYAKGDSPTVSVFVVADYNWHGLNVLGFLKCCRMMQTSQVVFIMTTSFLANLSYS